MSKYYNPPRTNKYNFRPDDPTAYELSRAKIELFIECPRCFFVDQRLGVKRVPGYPFSLNSAVDELFKKEFDQYRKKQKPHPLMEEHGVDAVPFSHRKMDDWRHHFVGVRTTHEDTGFTVYGAPDDIWEKDGGKLAVVDYKATSKKDEVDLEASWQDSWKRQMEIYQWLLRANGFTVSNRGFFVYANADKSAAEFADKLAFQTKILSYDGQDDWIDDTISEIKETLTEDKVPEPEENCDWCTYRTVLQQEIDEFEGESSQESLF